MANLIQVKRSLNTASPTSLANGEFAYTANGDVLFIGSNSAVVAIGGKRVPGTLTANQALVANATSGIDKVIVANAVVSRVWANGTHGTAGHVLTSGGTTDNIYWVSATSLATSAGGSNTQIQFNDSGSFNGSAGFTFNKTTNNLTIANTLTVGSATVNTTNYSGTSNNATFAYGKTESNLNVNNALTANLASYIVANSGLVSNSSGVFVNANTGVTANSSGVFIGQAVGTTSSVTFQDLTVNGNTIVGSDGNDTVTVNARVASNILPSANATYNVGNNTLRFNEVHAVNVHSEYLYIDKDVQVSGNLVVSGNVVTVNVTSLSVTDSLIQLASNNTISDTLDIGLFGNYQVGGGDHEHTGLFRDATDGNWKLFVGLTEAPTTTVNIAGTGYAKGTLDAYLLSGGLVTNATHVAVTANSTVNVAIVANTLTLSTALVATSGGTGQSSYTSGDILVANTGNALSKLALGTSGYVLQSNGTALVYDTLDGGTF